MPSVDHGDPSAGEALWRFSLALYGRPGVAEALIALQDRAGCDVDVILFAAWLGATKGRRIGADGLAAAAAAIAPEKKVVAQIRCFRRELKAAGDAPLRRRILALELDAERRVQQRLAATSPSLPAPAVSDGRLAAAFGNLAHCLGDARISPEADVLRRALAALMRRTYG